MNNVLSFLLILVLSGCSFTKLAKSPAPVDEDKMVFQAKLLFSDSNRSSYFVCDDFVSDALNNYSIKELKYRYLNILNCSMMPVVNKYDTSVMDTIYTFSNATNKIRIYRADQNDFIFIFNATDSLLKLKGNVKPGMSKDIFCTKFHIKDPINDKVQMANSEGSMRFEFYFKDDRLKRINSFWYLD